MNNRTLVYSAIIASTIAGCASNGNLSRGEQAGIGAASGAALGGLIGGLAGGGKWAGIGAASGAAIGGIVTYALASDPFTQTASKQAQMWENKVEAKPQIVKVSKVVEGDKEVDQIDIQKILISEKEMVSKSHVAKGVKKGIETSVSEGRKVGGTTLVLCPENAPQKVVNELSETGAQVKRDPTLKSGYALVMARNAKEVSV